MKIINYTKPSDCPYRITTDILTGLIAYLYSCLYSVSPLWSIFYRTRALAGYPILKSLSIFCIAVLCPDSLLSRYALENSLSEYKL